MTNEYTKGPWHVGLKTIIYDADGWAVANATVFHGRQNGPEVAEANARLIAAAPDLLDALISVREELRNLWTGEFAREYKNEMIDSAINKALGVKNA